MTDEFVLNELKDIRRQLEEIVTDDKGEAAVIDAVLRLPGVVGFWPMSVTNSSGDAVDVSGNALHLTNTSTSVFNSLNNTVGYVDYDGSADYHTHADAADFDITGTEAYIGAQGLAMGAWVYLDSTGTQGILTKWDSGSNNRSYALIYASGFAFQVSGDGTASVFKTHSESISTGSWYFVTAKFASSTACTVAVNGVPESNTTSIPASIYNGTAPFQIGAQNAGIFLNGRVSLAFLCSSLVSDAQLKDFYELSRPLFGV